MRNQLIGAIVLLLAAGACGRPQPPPADLNPRLVVAARTGDTAAVRELLQQGASVEAKDADGSTVLSLAADNGHLDTARLLLERGADRAPARLSGRDDVIAAASRRDAARLQLLLERGTDAATLNDALLAVAEFTVMSVDVPAAVPESVPDPQKKNRGNAAPFPDLESRTVGLLLEKGANIEARDADSRRTPLMEAAAHGATGMVKTLLERGTDIEATDTYGNTALMLAACICAQASMPDTLDVMKLLLEKKANVNAQNKDGITALMTAAGWGRTENVRLLLDHGADVRARNKGGRTALSVTGNDDGGGTARLLKQALAKPAARADRR